MNEGLIPRRYAKALLEFASEKGDSQKVYDLMKNLADSFVSEDSLQAVIGNPFVEDADKINLLKTAANAKETDTVYADFLALLAGNKRLNMMRAISLAYLDVYRKVNNIYKVEVVAASELTPDDETRLKALILTHLGGGSMEYSYRIEPDLIGGFVINIGSERLDASISNELKQLRLKLLSN